jgi:predicted nucleic acid-binding protein
VNQFFLDASALVKRYAVERGSDRLDHLFVSVDHERLICLMLGAAEVMAALVRKRNGGQLTSPLFLLAASRLRAEVVSSRSFVRLAATNKVISSSLDVLPRHPINSSDAVALQAALDYRDLVGEEGHAVVFVASDQRLLRAARSEGLVTFDPETDSQADLDVLIGP